MTLGATGMVAATPLTMTLTKRCNRANSAKSLTGSYRGEHDGHHISRAAKARPGGRLERFIAQHDTRNHPIFEDGLAYVSVEGHLPRRAVLGHRDFLRITAWDPFGPWLTRTRWWLDENNMLRAFSLHEKPMAHGVLVAAALLNASVGDVIEVPGDPFDLRLSQLRRVGG